RLKEELESIKEAGISGFTIFEIGSRDTNYVKSGPPFMGEESLEIIKSAVEQADKLGLEVGLNTASSWNAGGSWIKPKYAAKSIYRSKKKINGGSQQSIKLPFPDIPKKDEWGNPSMIQLALTADQCFMKK
ncbi:MAG: glycosyl hydrolase, partial [bacterium]